MKCKIKYVFLLGRPLGQAATFSQLFSPTFAEPLGRLLAFAECLNRSPREAAGTIWGIHSLAVSAHEFLQAADPSPLRLFDRAL